VGRGCPQGGVLSSLLWNLVVDKTELVLFTKKRKLDILKPPSIFGVSLNFATEVKYLGVMLDSKLHWGRHLQLKTEKAYRAFWQCRGAIGATWGLTPRTVMWLYVAVIRPMLTYGAIVWWS